MSYCICGKPSENKDTGECASCGAARRKAQRQLLSDEKVKEAKKFQQIRKVSTAQKKRLSDYSKIREEWIMGKICAVCKVAHARDVHHMKGRAGYADEQARNEGIKLLIDIRFWLPVCGPCHTHITVDSKWAIEQGYSLPRNQILK
jgi:ribosomal protein L37E